MSNEVAEDEARYLQFNPFEGDRDVDIQCRKVVVTTVRKRSVVRRVRSSAA